MSTIMKVIIVSACFLAGAAHADMKDNCPADIVNFWKNFAVKTENYTAIPVFLIENDCFRARVSTDFHTAMEKRFDHPEDLRYVDQLYAHLDWGRPVTATPH